MCRRRRSDVRVFRCLGLLQQGLGDQRAKGQRLSRAGLRRHQEIAALHLRIEDSNLHGRCGFVATCGYGFCQCWDEGELGKHGHERRVL